MNANPTHTELLNTIEKLEKQTEELKKAQMQLHRQTEFLNSVLESLSHPFYVIDVNDYTIKLANAAAEMDRLTGKSTCYALTHKRKIPCNTTEHPCPLEIVKKTKKPVVVEHIHYDSAGHPKNVEVHGHPIFDEKGDVSQIIEYCLDITERKRIEKALRESEVKFRSVTESANDAIISSDIKGLIVFWNAAAEKMFGYAEKEIIGRPLTVLMPAYFREAHTKAMKRYTPGANSRIIGNTQELVGLTKEGLEFPLELSISTWNAGEEIFYTGILRDITERKQIEKERDRLIQSLRDSLAKVKTLSGLLPICASCKKIRDDQGYWNQIEAYIHEHADVIFSHGICPECAKKLYPEYYEKIRK